jgi:hypothetical protein
MTSVVLLLLAVNGDVERLTKAVSNSGRVAEIAAPPSERLGRPARLAPGAPPLVSFRWFAGGRRHRFGNLDLVLDDAGH